MCKRGEDPEGSRETLATEKLAPKPRRKPLLSGEPKPKRIHSAEVRRRIAAAQRKRWAAFHANQNTAKKTAPKRRLSATVKAKPAKNLAKARAAKAAKAKRIAAAA